MGRGGRAALEAPREARSSGPTDGVIWGDGGGGGGWRDGKMDGGGWGDGWADEREDGGTDVGWRDGHKTKPVGKGTEGQTDGVQPQKGCGRKAAPTDGRTDGRTDPARRPPAALLLMLTLARASLAATRLATRHT